MNAKTVEVGLSLEGFIEYLGDQTAGLVICVVIAVAVSLLWATISSKLL